MRQFVIVGHDAPTTGEFSLDDLSGAAGRLDVLCRCVSAALFVSHGIREDAAVHLVVRDALTVTVDGGTVRRLNPDERSTAARIRDALDAQDGAIGHMPAEASPGVEIRRMGLRDVLDELVDGTLVRLHEAGDPVVEFDPPADPTFVLSDHRDLSDDEADVVDSRADERIRLGPIPLHADHAITVAHNYLDTDGYATY